MLVGGYFSELFAAFSHFLVPIFLSLDGSQFLLCAVEGLGVGSVHRHWPIRFVHRVQLHPGFVTLNIKTWRTNCSLVCFNVYNTT